jgi:tetratricopeptide (TPR) repeat protein
MRKLIIVLFLLAFPSMVCGAQEAKFEVQQAREAYDRGDYPAAITQYEALLKSGADSAALYYNLGNAEFKAGHYGRAIAGFRRALKRAPQDEDARYNLEYVRTLTRQPADKKGPLAQWLESAFGYFSTATLTLVALILFWMLMGMIGVIIITRNGVMSLRWVAACASLVFMILAGWASARIVFDRTHQWGVIVVERSEARNGPNPEFQVGFIIPEGREVRVLGHESNWVAVGLPSEGYKGWIKREDLLEDE